jgi:two-component system chemotaxis response regulator CheY
MKPTGIIVDDALIMRIRLREILEPDYDIVAEAGDGAEALEICMKWKPDFVTLDISMPYASGMEALETIRQALPETRIVMVSAIGQKRIVIDALRAGATDFVVKPFERDRVRAAIDRMFVTE